jgi:hypothetical protein
MEVSSGGTSGRCVFLSARCGRIFGVAALRIAQDPVADGLPGRDPLALLIGMLLDEHMRRRSSGVCGALGTCAAVRR